MINLPVLSTSSNRTKFRNCGTYICWNFSELLIQM